MRINREEFLRDLESVKSGLATREYIEQSSCFAFRDHHVMTFNDEVSCHKRIPINLSGAVQAQTLLSVLEKLDDPELLVRENEKGELEFKGKRKAFGVTKDAEVFLPVEKVVFPEEKDWKVMGTELTEAMSLVQNCVSQDESRFLLTCVHMTPEFVEACDNLQMMRVSVKTGMKKDVLVRGTSLVQIPMLGMDKIALTKDWIHFRNPDGLTYSCRRYSDEYPPLDEVLKNADGHPITLPPGIITATERAEVFAADKSGDPYVIVSLVPGKVRIAGEGLSGWYKEVKSVTYDGPPMEFVIRPELLKWICEKHKEGEVGERKLRVTGSTWEYVTVLGVKYDAEKPEDADNEDAPPRAKSKAKS